MRAEVQKIPDELLDFGVHRVLWIFTETGKVMLSEKNQNWLMSSWEEDLELMDGLTLNISALVTKRLKN